MDEETAGDIAASVASDAPPCPEPGRYRHYKGAEYEVLGCARHSESEEWLVVYRALYAERGLWARPLAMFTSTVEVGGRREPRFRPLEPRNASAERREDDSRR